MRDAGSLRTYVPVDISEEITQETARTLVEEYPGLDVHGMVCDYERNLERTPTTDDDGPRLIAFLGGTIGNLYPDQRGAFLARIAALLDPSDHLLLGTDLIKDQARLELAYDDPGGVTAEFNKNVLAVLNRELGADFDLDRFEHVAAWSPENKRIEIGLRSLVDQEVRVEDLDLSVHFDAGELMRTEISTKFAQGGLERVYGSAGLALQGLVHRSR